MITNLNNCQRNPIPFSFGMDISTSEARSVIRPSKLLENRSKGKGFFMRFMNSGTKVSKYLTGELKISIWRRNCWNITRSNEQFVSAFHAQANGLVEQGHDSIVNSLSNYCSKNPTDSIKCLPLVLWANGISVQRSTRYLAVIVCCWWISHWSHGV